MMMPWKKLAATPVHDHRTLVRKRFCCPAAGGAAKASDMRFINCRTNAPQSCMYWYWDRSGRKYRIWSYTAAKGVPSMKKLVLLLIALVIVAFAADISGNWKATAEGPQGQMERT